MSEDMPPESARTSNTAPAASLCGGRRPHAANAHSAPSRCAPVVCTSLAWPQAPAGSHSSQTSCSPPAGCTPPSRCVPAEVHNLQANSTSSACATRKLHPPGKVCASMGPDVQPGPTFVAGVDHILGPLQVRLPGVHQLSLAPWDQHDRAPVLQGPQEGLFADLPQPAPAAEVADDLQGDQVISGAGHICAKPWNGLAGSVESRRHSTWGWQKSPMPCTTSRGLHVECCPEQVACAKAWLQGQEQCSS